MVHENWRWQPLYRELKRLITEGTLGDIYHFTIKHVSRMVGVKMPILQGSRSLESIRGYSSLKPAFISSTLFAFSLVK